MKNYYGRDNLKNSFDDINDFEDEDEMMYYQGINYDRRFNNNFLPKFNYRYDLSNNYGYGSYNISNVINKNNFLKSQYPKIYNDINKIIDEIIYNYRNVSMTEKLICDIVDDVLDLYKKKILNLNTNEFTSNTKISKDYKENNLKTDNNIDKTVKIKDEDMIKDLIKIILITRLIKLNLDKLNINNRYNKTYNRYTPELNYDYNFDFNHERNIRSGFDDLENNNLYMGYLPRNYF